MTFTEIIYFKTEYIHKNESNSKKVWKFYDSKHPLAQYSGGSAVAMKNSDYWLDYYDVSEYKLKQFITFVNKMKDDELKANMYYKIRHSTNR